MNDNFVNLYNLQKIREAYLQGETKGIFYPSVFVIEPTNHCDLSCVMCPNSMLTRGELGYMKLKDFESILSKISPFAELTMLYFMGEPLQHPDFISIVRVARKMLKGKIVISTNCMLLSKKISTELISLKIDVIICCIDHWTKKRYEKIRLGGDFKTVVSNVEGLLRKKAQLKNSETNIIIKSLDFGFSHEEKISFENHWKKLGGITIIGWVDSWAGQFPDLRKLDYQSQPYSNTIRKACADLWFKMVINWNGKVVLCCHNYDYSIRLGDFKFEGLEKIWHAEAFVNVRNNHLQRKFACNKLCSDCTEWGTLEEMDTYVNLIKENLSLIF